MVLIIRGWKLFIRADDAIPTIHQIITVLVMKLYAAARAVNRIAADVLDLVADHEIAHEVDLLVVAALGMTERAISEGWSRLCAVHADTSDTRPG